MDPSTSSTTATTSKSNSPDGLVLKNNLWSSRDEPKMGFASVSAGEDKPFDFLHVLFDSGIAGGTAGVIVEAALYPIDTIKTRLQVARGGGKINMKGLYSGLAGNLVGVLPASAIFLGVYEPLKQLLLKTFPENLSALAHLVLLEGLRLHLFEYQQRSLSNGCRLGILHQLLKLSDLLLVERALKVFMRDMDPFCCEICLLTLFSFSSMSSSCLARRKLSNAENAIIGAFAGGITGAITTPLDVIKTRLMVQGSANHYKGICDCVKTIAREEGIHTLFKGMGPRVLWIGIGGSIFFGVLESTKEVLAQRHSKDQDSSSFKLG